MNNRINSPKSLVSHREVSRRHFLGASAFGAMAGTSVLSDPIQSAAQSVGIKPSDLPDLTIKEVKVYVADIGDVRRLNSSESGEIVSIVTNSGAEGNYTLGNRDRGTGWLDYAKGVCLGKSVVDLLPGLNAAAMQRAGRDGAGAGTGGTGRAGMPTRATEETGTGQGAGARAGGRQGGAGGGGGRSAFVGGFGYPNTGVGIGLATVPNYHAAIIDICLWDILGKTLNRPIYKLLGGNKDRMLAYASSTHLPNIEDFAPEAAKAKSEGFKAYKIHPGGGQHRSGGAIPAYVGHIEEIKEVRKAVGDEFTLLFDPVQRYNVFEALKVGRVLEEQGYVSFEDPVPTADIEGLIELRQKLDIPVEVGEFLYSIRDYAEYIRRGALDVVRLISDNVGGITGSFRVGQLAEAFGLPCTPHNWGNGFDLAVHFHLELAMPNAYWFELPYSQEFVDRPYFKHKFRVDKDGYIYAPTEPGLGYPIDRGALDNITTRIDR
jgi:L-alanine-DL-glutamate epimerase-like enolase superfamily enzyme